LKSEIRHKLPYCLKELNGQKFMWFDRDYLPIYPPFDQDCFEHPMSFSLTEEIIEKMQEIFVSATGEERTSYFLYNDRSIPYSRSSKKTQEYEKKVGLLKRLGIPI